MKITVETVKRALDAAVADHDARLTQLVERQDWRRVTHTAAYLDGLLYAVEIVNMLRLEEDTIKSDWPDIIGQRIDAAQF